MNTTLLEDFYLFILIVGCAGLVALIVGPIVHMILDRYGIYDKIADKYGIPMEDDDDYIDE